MFLRHLATNKYFTSNFRHRKCTICTTENDVEMNEVYNFTSTKQSGIFVINISVKWLVILNRRCVSDCIPHQLQPTARLFSSYRYRLRYAHESNSISGRSCIVQCAWCCGLWRVPYVNVTFEKSVNGFQQGSRISEVDSAAEECCGISIEDCLFVGYVICSLMLSETCALARIPVGWQHSMCSD
jgi:hypothetical protein